jgi:hypothetical protein
MPVAVECKPGSGGPPVPDRPKHGSAAQLVEPVPGIDEERPGRIGWVRAIGLGWQAGIHGRVFPAPRGVPARLLEQDLERIRPGRRGLDGGCVHLLPNGMDGALNPGRQACAEIEVAGRRRGRVADCLQKALGQKAVVDFSDADWANSRALVESHQSASHERSVGGPGRRLVGQPFGDAGHYVSEEF